MFILKLKYFYTYLDLLQPRLQLFHRFHALPHLVVAYLRIDIKNTYAKTISVFNINMQKISLFYCVKGESFVILPDTI